MFDIYLVPGIYTGSVGTRGNEKQKILANLEILQPKFYNPHTLTPPLTAISRDTVLEFEVKRTGLCRE